MPTSFIESLSSRYPRLWAKILNQVRIEMLEQGWNKHARKFDEVLMRKAHKRLAVEAC